MKNVENVYIHIESYHFTQTQVIFYTDAELLSENEES